MEQKFNPEEFKPAGDGFVRKEAIEDKEKAERMAHVEHSIRLKMDEAVEIAMAEIKRKTIDRVTQRAIDAGEEEGRVHDRGKSIEEFKNIENLQIVRLEPPYCCDIDRRTDSGRNNIKEIAYILMSRKEVSSNNIAMRTCSGGYYLIKDGTFFGVLRDFSEDDTDRKYFDGLLEREEKK